MAETSEKKGRFGLGPRVIIVGGGIMGLSLALMLERFNIDYVVLEKRRDDITPQVGAGVAIFPNAYRIIDQLGLYEEFAATSIPLEVLSDWWTDGTMNAANDNVCAIFKQVFGYPLIVMDRQQAVKNILGKIQDKSKIYIGKTVVAIDTSEDGVIVKLEGGEVVTGDLLVGADGVHSSVRSEMWRIGNERQPGCFKGEGPDSIKCNWSGFFGITELKGLKLQPGASTTLEKGRTIAVMSGSNRAYFIHSHVLPKELKGSEIRHFTDQERERYVEEHCNDPVRNGIKFGDLYKNRVRSSYVPLQQYALKKWHFGRIVLLGDTVHKPHPVTGQGAAMCIEDAATFVNLLTAQLDSGLPLDSQQVERMFGKLEHLRVARATTIVNQSFLAQSMQSWQNPLMKFFYMYVVPRLGVDFVLAQAMNTSCPAPRLEGLPVPDRQALVGYDDLNPDPKNPLRLLVKWAAFSTLLLSALTTVIFARAIPSLPELTVVPNHVSGILVIMLVEGWRRNSTMSLLQWPIIWTVLGDFILGWKKTIGLFLLATYFTHSMNGRFQYTAPSRPMVLPATRVIPLAIILANAIPRIMVGLGHQSWDSLQPLATISALFVLTSSLLWKGKDSSCGQEFADQLSRVSAFFGKHHVRYLYTVYAVTFCGFTYAHLNSVGFSFQPWSTTAVLSMLGHYLADLAFLIGTVSEVCFYTGLGRWVSAYAVMVPLGLLYVGPGPTYVAVWFWRETCLGRTNRRTMSGRHIV